MSDRRSKAEMQAVVQRARELEAKGIDRSVIAQRLGFSLSQISIKLGRKNKGEHGRDRNTASSQ